ncbi:hypothetical protein Tco_0550238 [Tanacetum coccineum]
MGQIPNVKDKRIDSWDKVQHGRVIPHQTRPIGPIPTRNDAMLDDEEHNGMLGISTESTPSEGMLGFALEKLMEGKLAMDELPRTLLAYP